MSLVLPARTKTYLVLPNAATAPAIPIPRRIVYHNPHANAMPDSQGLMVACALNALLQLTRTSWEIIVVQTV